MLLPRLGDSLYFVENLVAQAFSVALLFQPRFLRSWFACNLIVSGIDCELSVGQHLAAGREWRN